MGGGGSWFDSTDGGVPDDTSWNGPGVIANDASRYSEVLGEVAIFVTSAHNNARVVDAIDAARIVSAASFVVAIFLAAGLIFSPFMRALIALEGHCLVLGTGLCVGSNAGIVHISLCRKLPCQHRRRHCWTGGRRGRRCSVGSGRSSGWGSENAWDSCEEECAERECHFDSVHSCLVLKCCRWIG